MPTPASVGGQQAATPLPDRIRGFVDAPRFATIGTISEDGAPHQAVIWYALDGDRLLINSRANRHWPANLRRDPRISIAVYEDERPYHWVGLSGQAELLHEGAEAVDDIQALARRYGKDPGQYAGQERVSFIVTVDRTFEYGA
jgi:PPOX class probable F420-dependent enzyme